MSIEPIQLQSFSHMRVSNVREALKRLPNGDALIYTFKNPQSLYLGTVPSYASVIWRNKSDESLKELTNRCTYFTWNQIIEVLIVTGIIQYDFKFDNFAILLSFFISDAIKFASSIKVDDLYIKFEKMINDAFKDPLKEHHEIIRRCNELVITMHHAFQHYGVAITQAEYH